MKKKVLIILICIIVFGAGIVLWAQGRNVRVMDELEVDSLSKISMFRSGEEVVVTDTGDMEKILNALQSVRLDRKFIQTKKEGFAYTIDFYQDEKIVMSVAVCSATITVNGTVYHCDKDCCDELREIFDGCVEIPLTRNEIFEDTEEMTETIEYENELFGEKYFENVEKIKYTYYEKALTEEKEITKVHKLLAGLKLEVSEEDKSVLEDIAGGKWLTVCFEDGKKKEIAFVGNYFFYNDVLYDMQPEQSKQLFDTLRKLYE